LNSNSIEEKKNTTGSKNEEKKGRITYRKLTITWLAVRKKTGPAAQGCIHQKFMLGQKIKRGEAHLVLRSKRRKGGQRQVGALYMLQEPKSEGGAPSII